MRWSLPYEQGRRVAAVALLGGLAFAAQGPLSTAASFTGSASVQSSQFSTGTWCNPGQYPAAVAATGGVRNYLRLGDTGATTVVVDSAAATNGIRNGSATVFGHAGLLACSSDTAVQLTNTANPRPRIKAGGPNVASNTVNTFTITALVDVTGGQGRLIGLGRMNSATAFRNSNNDDRVLYVDSGGYLRFGIFRSTGPGPDTRFTIRSDAPITGGVHHVAASLSSAGMRMYVDGVPQVQVNATVTTGRDDYTGNWRVGYDTLSTAWAGITTGSTLPNATVDEVAIWHTALTDTQIAMLAGAGPS